MNAEEFLKRGVPPISLMETLAKSKMPDDVAAYWAFWTDYRAGAEIPELAGITPDTYAQVALIATEAVDKGKKKRMKAY